MIRILIADDDASITSGLTRMLDEALEGVQVHTCNHGLEALDCVRREHFDLVITDVIMPGMTGLDMLERMTEMGIRVPVLVISGYDNFAYVRRAMHWGADDYLLKPIKLDELLAAVRKALRTVSTPAQGMQNAALDEDVALYLLEQHGVPRDAVKVALSGITEINFERSKKGCHSFSSKTRRKLFGLRRKSNII